MDKNELRQKYKAVRAAIPRSERLKKSALIAAKLFDTPQYRECGKIFVYSNANTEAVTTSVINRAIEDGKITAVPKMTDNAHEMVFLEISSLYDLTETRHGIAEPVYNEEKIVKSDKSTLIIVPLLAFDGNGNRLGYGGGYYDKYLSENEYMAAAGIAYSEQKAENIPNEKNDVPLDIVITD